MLVAGRKLQVMARHRNQYPASSPHITPSGHLALTRELKDLWQRRAEVTRALSAAAAEGDRSENAEYIYRKKELRELDRRIRYLQKRLPDLKVVDRPPDDTGRVFFGAEVTLLWLDGRQTAYRIVGADEFDPAQNWISIDSPLARALLGKRIDGEVRVTTPGGEDSCTILSISYP